MKQELIRDLAITGGIYDCICDPYDKLKNGDPYSSVMIDLERFAEKIVRECMKQGDVLVKHYIDTHTEQEQALLLASIADYTNEIKKHFGVEE